MSASVRSGKQCIDTALDENLSSTILLQTGSTGLIRVATVYGRPVSLMGQDRRSKIWWPDATKSTESPSCRLDLVTRIQGAKLRFIVMHVLNCITSIHTQ